MFCTKCGAPPPEGGRFCTKCGSAVGGANMPCPPAAETEVFRQQRACYHPSPGSRITGEFVVTSQKIEFLPHYFVKPFQLPFQDVESVSEAYRSFSYVCFNVRMKGGKTYAFSLNHVSLSQTQPVADLVRQQVENAR